MSDVVLFPRDAVCDDMSDRTKKIDEGSLNTHEQPVITTRHHKQQELIKHYKAFEWKTNFHELRLPRLL